jgi:hypothetical protein
MRTLVVGREGNSEIGKIGSVGRIGIQKLEEWNPMEMG